jgi:hypothetical protein
MNAKGDKAMKGYKGFDNDLKCRGFQYEVGKTYECEGKITLCENGFHFCEDPKRICDYYGDLTTCRYCEIEASGEIVKGEGKCVCSKITIVREISFAGVPYRSSNEGTRNTGWANEGDWNKGDWNEGDSQQGQRTRATATRATGTRATGTRATGTGRLEQGRLERGRLERGRLERGRLERGQLEHRFIQSRRWSVRNLQHRWRMRNLQQIHKNQAHRDREDGRIPILALCIFDEKTSANRPKTNWRRLGNCRTSTRRS